MGSRAFLLFVVSAFVCVTIHAQTALATLTGAVTEASGAAIRNASITARHLDTGTIISGASSATGIYTLTQLPVGQYAITVEQAGFKTYKRESVSLAAAQLLRLDVELVVGATSDTVTVNAEASLLKTDTAAVTYNITVSQIQNLPMPITTGYVRDPLQFVQMLPAVRYAPEAQMVVNGLPPDQVQYRVDGQVMGNVRPALAPVTANVQPSVDSIQEVAIQTSNYSAEFGSVGGALFNFTMKSGTNQFHGSGFDYVANEALNAHTTGTHTRDKVRRNDWGATFGGPIKIPKLYDGTGKSFFFFAWERFDQSQTLNVFPGGIPTVPTPAYRGGDFSILPSLSGGRNLTVGARDYKDPLGNSIAAGTLFDPNSIQTVTCNTAVSQDCGANGSSVAYRTPLVGNHVPVTMFDPVSLAIMNKYIPLPTSPNASPAGNFSVPVPTQKVSSLPSIKLDHDFTTKTRLSFLYQLTRTAAPVSPLSPPEGFDYTITAGRGTFDTQNRYVLNLDHEFSPTLQGHLGAGWTQYENSDRAFVTDYNPAEDIGLKGGALNRNFPRFASTAATTATGLALGGMNAMGPAAQQFQLERRPSANLSLTWIKNSHTVKIGADWRFDMLPLVTYSNTAGNFASSGFQGITSQPALAAVSLTGASNTGLPFADWLLGSVRSFSMSTPISYRTSKQQWGLYLEDTWRITRKLTVEYGLRWDLGTYAKEDHGRTASFGPNVPDSAAGGRNGALIFEATCHCNIAQVYPYAVGPRLGMAYNINSKTVLRGGFGVAYNSTGFSPGVTTTNTASSPIPPTGLENFKLRDGIPSTINPVWPNFDPAQGQTPGQLSGAAPLLDQNAARPARTHQWNATLQREITRDMVVEVAYIANRGVWQNAGTLVDLNAVSVQQLGRYGFTVGNLDDATLLNTNLSALSTAQRSLLTSRGVALPYAGFPSTTTVLQSIRPFPQFGGSIVPAAAPLGKSWYDSLQISGTKRYSHGLLVNVNYTWSKNLALTSAPDIFNRSVGKGLSTFNLPQQLRISFEYQIQKFRSNMPILGNKWVNNTVAGWGLAAVLRYQSGNYLGRPTAGSTNPVSKWLSRGPGAIGCVGCGAQLKQNADGSYMNPWSIDWYDYSGKHHTDPLDINCHCFDPERTLLLNPAVWQTVPDGQFAADTSQLAFFRTQRLPFESANLSRTFRFGTENHYALQLRVEFQNVLNRTQFPTLQTNLPFNVKPAQLPDGRYNGGFGTFGPANTLTYGAPRSGMLVGRFTF